MIVEFITNNLPVSLKGSLLLLSQQPSRPMSTMQHVGGGMRLPPDVNRILFVKSLPYKISTEDIYDIFGKYGAIRQIRLGTSNSTRGTAYVVYEDIYEAKNACESLNGFQVAGRYLIVLYHQPKKLAKKS